MLSRSEARDLAVRRIVATVTELPPEDELVVVDEATIERPWGLVFFYTSKIWQETQNISYALAGNAPLLVDRRNGATHFLGTAQPVEVYLREYEDSSDPYAAK